MPLSTECEPLDQHNHIAPPRNLTWKYESFKARKAILLLAKVLDLELRLHSLSL